MVPRAATQRGIMVISVDILGLPFFKSASVSETKDSILINAEVVFYEAEACPFCQGTEQVRFGSKHQAFIDAPIRGKHVTVSIERQRFRCKGCGRTHSEYLPHLDDKRSMTERCLEYIQGQSLRLPFVQVAEDVVDGARSCAVSRLQRPSDGAAGTEVSQGGQAPRTGCWRRRGIVMTQFRFNVGDSVWVRDRGARGGFRIVPAVVREQHNHPGRHPAYPNGEGYALDGQLWWDCYPGCRVFATKGEAIAARIGS